MGRHLIFPVTAQDREAVGIGDEFEDEKTIGICVTAARIKEGFKRWDRENRPDPFTHSDTADAIQTLTARDTALRKQYQEDMETALSEKDAETEAALAAKDEEISKLTTENGLYKTRVNVKDKEITTLKSEKETYNNDLEKYKGRYGEVPTAPLNRFQRFVVRLFRIC